MNTAAGPMLSKEPGYKQESFAHHITGCALNIPDTCDTNDSHMS